MKKSKLKFKKIILCAITVSMFAPAVLSQSDNDSSVIAAKVRQAQSYILSNNQQRAYQLFVQCAAAGDAYSMNAIGILLQRGWGVEKDEQASVNYFVEAADAGYGRAYYNLAKIYAKGLGVEQDFAQAVDYFQQLIPYLPSIAYARLGYYYYKGFGVEQNYQTAVNYFRQAAELNSANAYFFLGLCYRNGYGVERNAGEAQYYLQKAADMGHFYSSEELANETAETRPQMQYLQMNSATANNNKDAPPTFRKIPKNNINGHFAGEYDGTLTVFDYSGTQIVRQETLKILFSEPDYNGNVHGQWIEADSIMANFEAILTDSTLQFVNTSPYARKDHYNRKMAVEWNFTEATLEKAEQDNGLIAIAGNIQMYSIKAKEPEKPMYIDVLQTGDRIPTGLHPRNKVHPDEMSITPLPASNEVIVTLTLEKHTDVILNIYTIDGRLMLSKNMGKLHAGEHLYTINVNLPKGTYVAQLQKKDKQISKIFIKY